MNLKYRTYTGESLSQADDGDTWDRCPCGKAIPLGKQISAIYCSPKCRRRVEQERKHAKVRSTKKTL